KLFWRNQAHRLVSCGRSHVRKLLFLNGVHVEVHGASVLPDHHSFVDLRRGTYEKGASLLKVVKRVSSSFTHSICNKRPGSSSTKLNLPLTPPQKHCVQQSSSFCLSQELIPETNQST